MIDSIVFDLGGVLISNDDDGLITNSNELQKILKTKPKELEKAWDISAVEFFRGKISEDKFFENFLMHFGFSDQKLIAKIKEIYRNHVKPLPSFDIALSLKKNYRLFALTNIPREWLEYKTEKFNLNKLFDGIIASCNVGTGKPNNGIYDSLIFKYKVIPEDSLYIDDSERNFKAGKEIGYDSILFENKEKLITDLNRRSIKI